MQTVQASCLKLNVAPSIHRIRSFGRGHRLLQFQRLLTAAERTRVDQLHSRVDLCGVLYVAAVLQQVPEGLGDHWHVSRQYLC